MFREVRVAFILFIALTLLTGVVYPLVVTGAAQLIFPSQANGSLITVDNRPVGSELLGQQFVGDKYFHGRPSAAGGAPYNGLGGAGSNLGPTNPALMEAVGKNVADIRKESGDSAILVPVDLVTRSASGLDPHISTAAALMQVSRVAKARGMSVQVVDSLVRRHVEGPSWGLFGAPRVNVLRLNLALETSHR